MSYLSDHYNEETKIKRSLAAFSNPFFGPDLKITDVTKPVGSAIELVTKKPATNQSSALNSDLNVSSCSITKETNLNSSFHSIDSSDNCKQTRKSTRIKNKTNCFDISKS